LKIRGPKPKLWRGYRNCDKCTRWRPVSDFTVHKTRTGYEQIKGECEHCKREREQARYDKLSPEQKRKRGITANKQAQKRRDSALQEIERLHNILDKQNEQLEKQHDKIERARKYTRQPRGTINGTAVDILPFRMWLLRQYRQHGYSGVVLADQMQVDERQIRRWIDGYEWNGVGRDPTPIRAIDLGTVDKISVLMNDPGLLERLYPLEVDDVE
jgi:hypothetical protein